MATKTPVTSITVNETDLKLGEVIAQRDKAPVQNLIAATMLLEDQIEQLKAADKVLREAVLETPYDSLIARMEADGTITPGTKPMISINTKYGTVINVSVNPDFDSGFEISSDLKDKKVLETVVPDEYKKTYVMLDTKKIEADYESGKLPSLMRGYCRKSPTEGTKLRKSVKSAT